MISRLSWLLLGTLMSCSSASIDAARETWPSPDKKHYVTRQRWHGEFELRDQKTGKFVRSFRCESEHVTDPRFSPDGRYLTAHDPFAHKVWLWDTRSGNLLRRIEHVYMHDEGAFHNGYRFAKDGRHLLVRGGNDSNNEYDTSSIWDLKSGTKIFSVPAKAFVITPGGDVTWQTETGSHTWNLATKRHTFTSNQAPGRPKLIRGIGHARPITAVGFSPDGGELATASEDGTIRFWSKEGREQARLQQPPQNTSTVRITYSPDGALLTSENSPFGLTLWDRETRKPIATWWNGRGGTFSPTGKEVLVKGDLYDVRTLGSVAQVCDLSDGRFSPSGRYILGTQSAILCDATTRKSLSWLASLNEPAEAVALSNDDQRALVFEPDAVSLRETATGTVVARFPVAGALQDRQVAWVSGEGYFITGSYKYTSTANIGSMSIWGDAEHRSAALWSARTGAEHPWLRQLDLRFTDVRVSPIPGQILIRNKQSLQLRDAATGNVKVTFAPTDDPRGLVFSADGRYLAAAAGTSGAVWDAQTGALLRGPEPKKTFEQAPRIAASEDERTLVATLGAQAVVWDLELGRPVTKIMSDKEIRGVVVSPTGSRLAFNAWGREAIWRREGTFEQTVPVNSSDVIRFSPDERFLYSNGPMDSFCWDLQRRTWCTGKERDTFDDEVSLSSSGVKLAASYGNRVEISDPRSRRVLKRWKVRTRVETLRFAPGSERFVRVTTYPAGSRMSEEVQWFDAANGRPVSTGEVASAAQELEAELAARNRTREKLVLHDKIEFRPTPSGIVELRKPAGEAIGEMVSFPDGAWAVVDEDGRFDTDLEHAGDLGWDLESQPAPLPLEVFMRDYFEPRLLSRLLSGEALRPAVRVDHLNTERRRLTIASVKQVARDLIEVVIASEAASDGKRPPSLHDVRLFRDGHLVARYPEAGASNAKACKQAKALERWRCETLVPDAGPSKPLAFRVRIPVTSAMADVNLTAYGFNGDRIKTETVSATFRRPADWMRPPDRTTRILAVGVASNDNRAYFGLTHPEKDARDFSAEIAKALRKFGTKQEILLLTDPNGPAVVAGRPTKENVRLALASLSRSAPSQAQNFFTRAEPEDLAVIYFSAHGLRDQHGEFYLAPADMPKGDPTTGLQAMLPSAISASELSSWLSEIDAGRIVLIIDACHAGSLTGGSTFRPGPMGETSFGQLAFDKGIQVLSATEPQARATTSLLARSLLTDVLIRDCLHGKGKTNGSPVTLDHALSCSVKGVLTRQESNGGSGPRQVPSLFDYGKKQFDVVLQLP